MAVVKYGLKNFCTDMRYFALKNWSICLLSNKKVSKAYDGYFNLHSIPNFDRKPNKSKIMLCYSMKGAKLFNFGQENFIKVFSNRVYSSSSKDSLKLRQAGIKTPIIKYFKKFVLSDIQRNNSKCYHLTNNIRKKSSIKVQQKLSDGVDYYYRNARSEINLKRLSPLLRCHSDSLCKKRLPSQLKCSRICNYRNNFKVISIGKKEMPLPTVFQSTNIISTLLKFLNRINPLSCNFINLGNVNKYLVRTIHYRSTSKNLTETDSYCEKNKSCDNVIKNNLQSVKLSSKCVNRPESSVDETNKNDKKFVYNHNETTEIKNTNSTSSPKYKDSYMLKKIVPYESLYVNTHDNFHDTNDESDKTSEMKNKSSEPMPKNTCSDLEQCFETDSLNKVFTPSSRRNVKKCESQPNVQNNYTHSSICKILCHSNLRKKPNRRCIHSRNEIARKYPFIAEILGTKPKFRHNLKIAAMKINCQTHDNKQNVNGNKQNGVKISTATNYEEPSKKCLNSSTSKKNDEGKNADKLLELVVPANRSKAAPTYEMDPTKDILTKIIQNSFFRAITSKKLLNSKQTANKRTEKGTPMSASDIIKKASQSATIGTVNHVQVDSLSDCVCSVGNNSSKYKCVPAVPEDKLKTSNNVSCNVTDSLGRYCGITITGIKDIDKDLPLLKNVIDKNNNIEEIIHVNKCNKLIEGSHSYNRKNKTDNKDDSDGDEEDKILHNLAVIQCNHNTRDEQRSHSSDRQREKIEETAKLQTSRHEYASAVDPKQTGNINPMCDIKNNSLFHDKSNKVQKNKIRERSKRLDNLRETAHESINILGLVNEFEEPLNKEVNLIKKYPSSRLSSLMSLNEHEHINVIKMFSLGKNTLSMKSSSSEKFVETCSGVEENSNKVPIYVYNDNLNKSRRDIFSQTSAKQQYNIKLHTSSSITQNKHNKKSKLSKLRSHKQNSRNKNENSNGYNMSMTDSPYHINNKMYMKNCTTEAVLNGKTNLTRNYNKHVTNKHECRNLFVDSVSGNNNFELDENRQQRPKNKAIFLCFSTDNHGKSKMFKTVNSKQNIRYLRCNPLNKRKSNQNMTEPKDGLKRFETFKYHSAMYNNRKHQETYHQRHVPFLVNTSLPAANDFSTSCKLSNNTTLKNSNLNTAFRNEIPEDKCEIYKTYKNMNTGLKGGPNVKLDKLNSEINKFSQKKTKCFHDNKGTKENSILLDFAKPNRKEYLNIKWLTKTNQNIDRGTHKIPENYSINTKFTPLGTVNKSIKGLLDAGTKVTDHYLLPDKKCRSNRNAKENPSELRNYMKNKFQSDKIPVSFSENRFHSGNLELNANKVLNRKMRGNKGSSQMHNKQAGKKTEVDILEKNIKDYQKRDTNYIMPLNNKYNTPKDSEKLNCHNFENNRTRDPITLKYKL